MIANYF